MSQVHRVVRNIHFLLVPFRQAAEGNFSGLFGERIADLIKEASARELTYEGAQKKLANILKQVRQEVKEYLDTQSVVDCMTFMDESFDSLRKFSDAFNVLPFIPVTVGTAITHHSLLTSLWMNVSHFPLKIFLRPLRLMPLPRRDRWHYSATWPHKASLYGRDRHS